MQIFLQAFIFFAVIGLTAQSYRIVFAARNKITCSAAMLAAMICGSMAGLIAGTLLALYQPYSINSLLAMIIGIGAGLMIGLPFNTLAMLEGLMAGVMGGLMGAMMGDMLAASFILPLSFFLVVIFGVCTALLKKAAEQEPDNAERAAPDTGKIKSLSILTIFVTFVLFTGVLAGSLYGKQASSYIPADHSHHHHYLPE